MARARRHVGPGEAFGTLTVLADAPRDGRARRRVLCRCECGRERVVVAANLVNGNSRSCGHAPCSKRWDWRRLPPGEQAATVIYLNYRVKARERGLPFELTKGEFRELAALPCSYCGSPPSNRTRDRWGEGAFVYSGIDRVDPKQGYTLGNVVPACITCNRAKSDLSIEEFRAWLGRACSVTLKGGGFGPSVPPRG